MDNQTDIPAHQLCPDCKVAPRALALGLTGYSCLCVDCFNQRIAQSNLKHKPAKVMSRATLNQWPIENHELSATPRRKEVFPASRGRQYPGLENRLNRDEVVYAVNENGDRLQDLIMMDILRGVDKLPDGFVVDFIDGNTLNCRRANLILVPV